MPVKIVTDSVSDVPIYRSKVSPVIGTNVGPSVIGVAVLGGK